MSEEWTLWGDSYKHRLNSISLISADDFSLSRWLGKVTGISTGTDHPLMRCVALCATLCHSRNGLDARQISNAVTMENCGDGKIE